MIDIKLKNFQEDAVDFLFSKTTDSNSKPKIVMQSPTGSGKTIILVAYIENILISIRIVSFVGSVRERENLKSNRKKKMERFAANFKDRECI